MRKEEWTGTQVGLDREKNNLGMTPEYISTIPTSWAILPTLSCSAYLLRAQKCCNGNFYILCLFYFKSPFSYNLVD